MVKLTISPAGVDFIKKWETFVSEPYKDSAGVWTIGYGTTRIKGVPVGPNTPPCTEAQATGYLMDDVNEISPFMSRELQTVTLTQNQVDALFSFAYNLGTGAFDHSTLCRIILAGSDVQESMFTAWNKIHNPTTGKLEELAGLTRRRREEFQLFSKE